MTKSTVAKDKSFEDLVILAIPASSFQKLSQVSDSSGITVAQLLTRAVDDFLKKLGQEIKK